MSLLFDAVYTLGYAILGVIMMLLGNRIIDAFIPGDFPTEIKRGNRAVAWLCAGSYIGIGLLVRTAIVDPMGSSLVEHSLWRGLMTSVFYTFLGIIAFMISYRIVDTWHRPYSLYQEIMRGNVAAGIVVFGLFVGLALVISGAIY